MTFKDAFKAALGDALELPSGAVRRPAARGGSLHREDAGYLVELLAEAPTACPACGKALPRPATRLRRVYALRSAAGAVLHLEVDP